MGISLLFFIGGMMIYQSCHQIMFVQYMPFLMLALLGIDRYWEKGKTPVYIGRVSDDPYQFYFVSPEWQDLCCISWYRSPEKLSVGKVIHFFVPMGVAVLSGSVLLVPTACALLQRSGSSEASLTDLLMPDLCLDKSLYNPYSVGLTMLLVTALLAGILCGRIRERLVSMIGVALLVFPVFAWGFNGALYVRYKSLIPFLPLFCYLIAVFLRRMKEGEIGRWKGMLVFAATVGVSVLAGYLKEIRRKWRQIPVDPAGERGAFRVLYPVSEVETATAFAGTFSGMSDRCQRSGERGRRAIWYRKTIIREITDDAWGEEIAGLLQKETGLYRTEQSGVPKKRKDNVNRVWNTRQWITSVYSSAYNQEFQGFPGKDVPDRAAFPEWSDADGICRSAVSEIHGSQICDRSE